MNIGDVANMIIERVRDGAIIGAAYCMCVTMGRFVLVYLPRITAALEKIAAK